METNEDELSVRPKIRHHYISTASTTSIQSHVQALETAVSTMDNDKADQEEELEINTADPPDDNKEQRKTKLVTKLLYGGIPADPKDIGLQIYAHDPKKYINFDNIMIGKEIKAGNLKFTFTNCNFRNREEKIKRHLEAGSIEVNGSMIIGRHKLKGIRNEFADTQQPTAKTAK